MALNRTKRAFSDDSDYDIAKRYQTLPRAVASLGFGCNRNAQRLADVAELGIDLASGRVTAGFARNPSGFLRSPVGYPLLNSRQFTHAATYSEIASEDVNDLSNIMQATQSVQYVIGAYQ
jgi:hypothetical protein